MNTCDINNLREDVEWDLNAGLCHKIRIQTRYFFASDVERDLNWQGNLFCLLVRRHKKQVRKVSKLPEERFSITSESVLQISCPTTVGASQRQLCFLHLLFARINSVCVLKSSTWVMSCHFISYYS